MHVFATPLRRVFALDPGESHVLALTATRDRWIAAITNGRGVAHVWQGPVRTSTGAADAEAGPALRTSYIALSNDGRDAAALKPGGDVEVWRITPWRRHQRKLPHIVGPLCMAPTEFRHQSGGRLIGVTGLTASIWDVSTDHRLTTTQLSVTEPDQTNRVIFSPRWAAHGNQLGHVGQRSANQELLVSTVDVLDTRTGRHVATLQSPPHNQQPAAFSHDGTRVLTVSDDSTTRVWDTR